jgi:hypothetical protein
LNREATMERMARLHTPVEDHGRAVIDDGHPFTVDAIRGPEHLLCEVSCEPGDEGLLLGTPGRQGTDPHGHTRLAVLASEKPFPDAATRGMRQADASAMAGEGVGYD